MISKLQFLSKKFDDIKLKLLSFFAFILPIVTIIKGKHGIIIWMVITSVFITMVITTSLIKRSRILLTGFEKIYLLTNILYVFWGIFIIWYHDNQLIELSGLLPFVYASYFFIGLKFLDYKVWDKIMCGIYISAAFLLFYIVLWIDQGSFGSRWLSRWTSNLHYPISFGNICALFALFCINDLLNKSSYALKILGIISISIFLGGIILSETRISIIAVIVVTIYIVLSNHRKFSSLKLKYIGLIIGLLIIIFTAIFSKDLISRYKLGISHINQYFIENNVKSNDGSRLESYRVGWIFFSQNPIFGTGIERRGWYNTDNEIRYDDMIQELHKEGETKFTKNYYQMPHNQLLYNAVQMGFLGFILVFMMIIFLPAIIFYRAYNSRVVNKEISVLNIFYLCTLIFAMTDIPFLFPYETLFFMSIIPPLLLCDANFFRHKTSIVSST